MDSVSSVFRSKRVAKPDAIIFMTQVLLLFIVVITSLANLSIGNGNENLWTMVLFSAMGYMMPSPRLKTKDAKDVIPLEETDTVAAPTQETPGLAVYTHFEAPDKQATATNGSQKLVLSDTEFQCPESGLGSKQNR